MFFLQSVHYSSFSSFLIQLIWNIKISKSGGVTILLYLSLNSYECWIFTCNGVILHCGNDYFTNVEFIALGAYFEFSIIIHEMCHVSVLLQAWMKFNPNICRIVIRNLPDHYEWLMSLDFNFSVFYLSFPFCVVFALSKVRNDHFVFRLCWNQFKSNHVKLIGGFSQSWLINYQSGFNSFKCEWYRFIVCFLLCSYSSTDDGRYTLCLQITHRPTRIKLWLNEKAIS